MADPEEYRSREEVEEWRRRDPIEAFRRLVTEEGLLSDEAVEKLDTEAQEKIEEAVRFADDSPSPDLASLYDDVYVMEGSSQQAFLGGPLAEDLREAMSDYADADGAWAPALPGSSW